MTLHSMAVTDAHHPMVFDSWEVVDSYEVVLICLLLPWNISLPSFHSIVDYWTLPGSSDNFMLLFLRLSQRLRFLLGIFDLERLKDVDVCFLFAFALSLIVKCLVWFQVLSEFIWALLPKFDITLFQHEGFLFTYQHWMRLDSAVFCWDIFSPFIPWSLRSAIHWSYVIILISGWSCLPVAKPFSFIAEWLWSVVYRLHLVDLLRFWFCISYLIFILSLIGKAIILLHLLRSPSVLIKTKTLLEGILILDYCWDTIFLKLNLGTGFCLPLWNVMIANFFHFDYFGVLILNLSWKRRHVLLFLKWFFLQTKLNRFWLSQRQIVWAISVVSLSMFAWSEMVDCIMRDRIISFLQHRLDVFCRPVDSSTILAYSHLRTICRWWLVRFKLHRFDTVKIILCGILVALIHF